MLWYLAGPDGYTLQVPAGIGTVRMATVTARNEQAPDAKNSAVGKVVRIVAHPASAITFEASERVAVHVTGSDRGDVMLGPVYAGAIFEGGAGDDRMVAQSGRRKDRHAFYGGAGHDTLEGGPGRDTLDGGPGDDVITTDGPAQIFGGPGNDSITAGDGDAVIHTGPGRNLVTGGAGRMQLHCGPGDTRVAAGPGGADYHIAWGGVVVITGWRPGDPLYLDGWPLPPEVTQDGADTCIRCGTGLVLLEGCTDPDAVRRALVL